MPVVVSIAALLATVVFGYFSALRAQYERVIDVVGYIGSAEVADARHQLGLMIHRRPPAIDETERSRDLFTILWAFNRIDAVRQTLPEWRVLGGRLAGPRRLLMHSTKPWVAYWTVRLEDVRATLDLDIEGSDVGLKNLATAWL